MDGIDFHAGKNPAAERPDFRCKFVGYQCSPAEFFLRVISETPRAVYKRIGRLDIDIHRESFPVQFHLHHRAAQYIPQSAVRNGLTQKVIG